METTSILINLFDPVEPNETVQLDQPSGAFQPAQTCLDDPDRLVKVMSFAKVTKSDVAVQTQCSNCLDSIKSRWT